ncbi:TPM domain-containing protein [Sphingomonas sp. H39-1-10]|uniref:TPM domain-containing protein n=1 Tax=Sphingomonas TaxID=13687 RepID=UPI000B85DCA1|nr:MULTISPECIES: TPM domain-containing protein [Sphingomonas]MDF0486755.1 TPM domain-containing protein [Sphingomonas pollutisoli]
MPLLRFLLLLLAGMLIGTPAGAQTYPKFTGLVVDAANVLPPATRADLEAKLEALQKDTHRQLVVATIPDLQGNSLEDYGIGLLGAWGPGLKDVDNGAILFIAPNEPAGHRGPRIEVGYGLEPILTDAFSGVTIRQQMMPKLRAGDVPGAMEAGTDALIAQLRASPEEAKARTDAAIKEFNKTHQRQASGSGGDIPFGLIVWGFIILFVALSWFRRAGGSRYVGQSGGGSAWPVILWGLGNEIGRGSGGGFGGGWGSGGGSSGSDGSWGGGGFTGGGGGSGGGGGASGDW